MIMRLRLALPRFAACFWLFPSRRHLGSILAEQNGCFSKFAGFLATLQDNAVDCRGLFTSQSDIQVVGINLRQTEQVSGSLSAYIM